MRPSTVTTPLPSACACLEGGDDPARHLELGGRRREDLVARLDLAGMDQGLAVEAHFEPLPADGAEALGVLDVVVDAVEDGEAIGPRRQHAEAERRDQRQAHRRVARAHVLHQIVGAHDEQRQPRMGAGDLLGAQDALGRLHHRPHRQGGRRAGGVEQRHDMA